MKKCQKCKKKIALTNCNSCSSFFCLECDRLIHNISKNKKHKRANITTSLLNLEKNKKINSFDDKIIKNRKGKVNIKGDMTKYNFHKAKNKELNKEDPNIHLINKLKNNLDNNFSIENQNILYKNDFNKLYKYIRITNTKNNIDINNLLDIIEQQDIIINDLFKKVYYLKQYIKENNCFDKTKAGTNEISFNIKKDEKYFEKKLDIINKIYEKQRQELIKEQEEKILKIQKDYDDIKDKYISIMKGKENHFEKKEEINKEINKVLNKLLLDKKNLNLNNNQLSKINKELNIV